MPCDQISHIDIDEDFCVLHFDKRTKSKKIPYHPSQMVPVLQANAGINKHATFHKAFYSVIQDETGVSDIAESTDEEHACVLALSSFNN